MERPQPGQEEGPKSSAYRCLALSKQELAYLDSNGGHDENRTRLAPVTGESPHQMRT